MNHENAEPDLGIGLESVKPEDIQPAVEFAQSHPNLFPRKNTLSWMVRNRNRNGLSESGALLYFNGKTYIVVPKYLQLLLSKTT